MKPIFLTLSSLEQRKQDITVVGGLANRAFTENPGFGLRREG